MYFEEFTLDLTWTLDSVKIERSEMLDFAHKYDDSPIHVDEEYGKRSKFGDIIAPGTMTAMKLWNEWQQYGALGDEFLAGTECDIEWFAAVLAGDEIHGKAYVSKIIDRNPYNGMVYVIIEGYNQNNELVFRTTNKVILKKKFPKSPVANH